MISVAFAEITPFVFCINVELSILTFNLFVFQFSFIFSCVQPIDDESSIHEFITAHGLIENPFFINYPKVVGIIINRYPCIISC